MRISPLRRCLLLFFAVVLMMPPLSFALDQELEQALSKANQGDPQQAISDLEKLKSAYPGDARIYLSLGLLYQSTDQLDKAIDELERAVGLSPSVAGYYALGLLYESKGLSDRHGTWKEKAIQAWQDFLQLAALDHPRRAVAEKHLRNLKAQ